MNRRVVLAAGTLALAGMVTVPAAAAPKIKPFKGSYKVTLYPDPTGEAGATTFGKGCTSLTQALGDQQKSVHRKPLTIPGKGTLTVTLKALDPSNGAAVIDWDLHIETADGSDYFDKSVGQGSDELTKTKFTKKTKIAIEVCNYTGHPDATITYAFKP